MTSERIVMNGVPKNDSKYSAPTLVKYGDMVKLTASGSMGLAETNTTGQPNKLKP
jgi:hypothetical protein